MSAYLLAIFILAGIHILLGLGLNLEWGHMGLVNFGHVAFFAVGAYTSALLTLAGAPIVAGVAAGALVAAVMAYLLGWLTIRLKEDYLAIVTLGFAEVVRIFLQNQSWTGGPSGLPGIPALFGFLRGESQPVLQLVLVVLLVAAAFVAMTRITESPLGRLLRAIRDNDTAAQSVAKDVVRHKVWILTVGSLMAGVAGAIYAHYIGYVVPEEFLPLVTFYLWAGIVLGGNSHKGAAAGTFLIIALFEATRFLGDFGVQIDPTLLAHVRYILIGALLIVMLQFRPQGVLPYRHVVRKNRLPQKGGL